jgi:hypothetical protein
VRLNPLKSVHVRANSGPSSSVSFLEMGLEMRIIPTLLSLGLLAAPAFADAWGHCGQAFQTGFLAGGKLSIRVRPADIEISGADVTTLRVTCTTSHEGEDLGRVSIHFHGGGSSSTLEIEGGSTHNSGVKVRIEVPRRSNLHVRSNAGDMKVANVTGDKDVELYAGNLQIGVGDPGDYRHVDASLMAGNLEASVFSVNKNGLFRSFSQDNPKGKYNLHAHLMAGNLVLR